MTGRAGIYGRNSKKKAKSITDQLKLGRLAVKEQGWELAGEYSDGGSASRYATKTRGNWVRLLADIEAGKLDILILWESSRGSREPSDWERLLTLCRDRAVRVYVINDDRTYDLGKAKDLRDLRKDGAENAYESDRLGERVRRGVTAAAMDGAPHGRVAFGYDGRYDPETKRPVRVPNADAVIVRELFDRLAAMTPISTLEKDFRARQAAGELSSPSGMPWGRNTIRKVATRVAYIGKRLHEGELYDAQWPGIVDEGTFWRVQEILGDPARRTTRGDGGTRPGSAKYLLSYIAKAPCGGPMRREAVRPGRLRSRYVCHQDQCVAILEDEVDEMVTRVILARLGRPDARKVFAPDDVQARAAKAEAGRLRGQLEDARKSFESVDGISAEALARKERALLPLIEDADRRGRSAGTSEALEELLDADDRQAAWNGLEMAARREVVKSLASVVVGPSTRRLSRWTDRDERLAEALARLGGSTWAGSDTTWAA